MPSHSISQVIYPSNALLIHSFLQSHTPRLSVKLKGINMLKNAHSHPRSQVICPTNTHYSFIPAITYAQPETSVKLQSVLTLKKTLTPPTPIPQEIYPVHALFIRSHNLTVPLSQSHIHTLSNTSPQRLQSSSIPTTSQFPLTLSVSRTHTHTHTSQTKTTPQNIHLHNAHFLRSLQCQITEARMQQQIYVSHRGSKHTHVFLKSECSE